MGIPAGFAVVVCLLVVAGLVVVRGVFVSSAVVAAAVVGSPPTPSVMVELRSELLERQTCPDLRSTYMVRVLTLPRASVDTEMTSVLPFYIEQVRLKRIRLSKEAHGPLQTERQLQTGWGMARTHTGNVVVYTA